MNPWLRRGIYLAGGAGAVAAWMIFSPAAPIKVIDGDTVERSAIRHRLVGFDAPEVRRTKCATEKSKGLAAKSRLEQLLITSERVRLLPTGRPDKWGRMLSRLELDGRDVADIAVAEGWGIRIGPRDPKPDWCLVRPAPLPEYRAVDPPTERRSWYTPPKQ